MQDISGVFYPMVQTGLRDYHYYIDNVIFLSDNDLNWLTDIVNARNGVNGLWLSKASTVPFVYMDW